jgi:hypothetical protein
MSNDKRIIAIDPRSSRFGFAVFEGPERLLDWGIKRFHRDVNAVQIQAKLKLINLMDEFLPHAVVILKRDVETRGIARMREALLRQAQKRGIALHFLSRRDVDGAFVGSNRNKYAIAAAVIKHLPELASRRPRQRKTWEPEHCIITIFDAAALGITYFARQARLGKRSFIPSREA